MNLLVCWRLKCKVQGDQIWSDGRITELVGRRPPISSDRFPWAHISGFFWTHIFGFHPTERVLEALVWYKFVVFSFGMYTLQKFSIVVESLSSESVTFLSRVSLPTSFFHSPTPNVTWFFIFMVPAQISCVIWSQTSIWEQGNVMQKRWNANAVWL